jgi:hypothetical protein
MAEPEASAGSTWLHILSGVIIALITELGLDRHRAMG